MNQGLSLLGGIGLGAGLMYFFDPNAGRSRRALLRDQFIGAMKRLNDSVDTTIRDVSHRSQGPEAEIRSWLAAEPVSDEVLVDRVRSKIGRYVSHPHAPEVAARDGTIFLKGFVLRREVNRLLRAAWAVRGVADVDVSRLNVDEEPGNLPSLQGGHDRPGERLNVFEENWAPATRLLAGTVGCALMTNCLVQRTLPAALLGTVGFGLFVRSLDEKGEPKLHPLSS
jgi:hypothetical protein